MSDEMRQKFVTKMRAKRYVEHTLNEYLMMMITNNNSLSLMTLSLRLSLSCLFSNLIIIMIINQTPAAPVEVLAMLSISSDFGLILKTFPMAMVFPSSLKVNLPN